MTRAGVRGDLQARSVRDVEQGRHDDERDDDDRRQVGDEREEREVGGPGDEDVRRVADERRGAADVGREDLDEDERDRVDVERVCEQERDRHHEQHRGEVVEEGGEHGRRPGEAQGDRERPAAGELSRSDRQVRVDPGRLREPDDDHHPGQQAERVPVDRIDRLLLADRLREQDGDGAEERDLRPIDPLGGDRGEREDEDGDGGGHAKCAPTSLPGSPASDRTAA
jgi:hypothetical protein